MRDRLANPSFRSGFQAGLPVAVAGFALAISFGVLARPVIGVIAPIVMSAIVFAGSAQFGSVAVLAAGGGPLAAIGAGILLNLRYVPMGVALAPSLGGGPLKRMVKAQAMVDYSWAAAMRGQGQFDVWYMIGLTIPMYVTWVAGTAVGVLLGDVLGDPEALGLDAMFPAFFLALLLGGGTLDGRRAKLAAALGGAIALVLVPLTPPGVPVIAACSAALIGLERARPEPAADRPGDPASEGAGA